MIVDLLERQFILLLVFWSFISSSSTFLYSLLSSSRVILSFSLPLLISGVDPEKTLSLLRHFCAIQLSIPEESVFCLLSAKIADTLLFLILLSTIFSLLELTQSLMASVLRRYTLPCSWTLRQIAACPTGRWILCQKASPENGNCLGSKQKSTLIIHF